MTVNDFVSKVLEIAAARPVYHLGDDGSNGQCDCVGLVIGAIRRNGIKYTEIHGSNWFARHHTKGLMRVTAAEDLSPGDLVYKAKPPGVSGYDLPSRYAKDPEKYDYYHIGVVTSVDPLAITHCTSSSSANGIVEDQKLGNWTHKGQLDLITYAEEDTPVTTTAKVTAANGKPVNMRKKPSTTSNLVDRVDVGKTVKVISSNDAWSQIEYNGLRGYMMTKFLEMEQQSEPTGIEQRIAELTKAVADLQRRVSNLEEANSVG